MTALKCHILSTSQWKTWCYRKSTSSDSLIELETGAITLSSTDRSLTSYIGRSAASASKSALLEFTQPYPSSSEQRNMISKTCCSTYVTLQATMHRLACTTICTKTHHYTSSNKSLTCCLLKINNPVKRTSETHPEYTQQTSWHYLHKPRLDNTS